MSYLHKYHMVTGTGKNQRAKIYNELSFPYKPNAWHMLLVVLFFGPGALLLVNEAANNSRGLIINHIIELNTHSATIFYWGFAGLLAVCAAFGVLMFFVGLISKSTLALTSKAISAPKFAWSNKPVVVQIRDIIDLEVQTINNQKLLHIRYRGGKLSIAQSMLPQKEDFEQIKEFLITKMGTR